MAELFWGCFLLGVLFALAVVLLGDLFHLQHLHFLQPVVLVGGITVFGGAGILLERYSALTAGSVLLLSLLLAVVIAAGIYFLYVKRMRQAENSTGYSIQELVGRMGEVSTAISASGFGEVVMKAGAGWTNQIAASFDVTDIPAGTRVVVVEVKEGTLYVSPWEAE